MPASRLVDLPRVTLSSRLLALPLVVGAFACSGDDGGSSTGQEGGETGSAPPPGVSAEGWESVFEEGSVRIDCEQSAADMAAAGAPSLSFGDSTIYVGYRQIGDNQDPVVARFDGETKVWCQYHETEGPDGRALGLTWDGGEAAYVVYTIVGGGSSLEGKGGWLSSYAPGSISGGGPKVSVAGRVGVSDGALESATFVIAVKSDNKVNSHSPRGPLTVLDNGNVEFSGSSAHKPIDADGKQSMDCTDYPFDSKYVFSPDLSSLVCAECSNCVAQQPCE